MTSLRLDKWLWSARFAKTRSLAAKLCAGGCVTVGGATVSKAGHPIRIGDAVAVEQGRVLRRVIVLALSDRRGPPAEARLLYAEPEPPLPLRPLERLAWTPLIDDEIGDRARRPSDPSLAEREGKMR
jgi:ribosome-associated heat shock protein Hsp15